MTNPTLGGGARPWRLGSRTRKGVLVVHIVSAGVWIGIDVVMAVIIFSALLATDDNTKALCYRALELFAVWPLLTAGLVGPVEDPLHEKRVHVDEGRLEQVQS